MFNEHQEFDIDNLDESSLPNFSGKIFPNTPYILAKFGEKLYMRLGELHGCATNALKKELKEHGMSGEIVVLETGWMESGDSGVSLVSGSGSRDPIDSQQTDLTKAFIRDHVPELTLKEDLPDRISG